MIFYHFCFIERYKIELFINIYSSRNIFIEETFAFGSLFTLSKGIFNHK